MKIFQLDVVFTDKPAPHGNHQAGQVQLVRDFLRQNGFLTEIEFSRANAFLTQRSFVVLDACDASVDHGLHQKYVPRRLKEIRAASMTFFDGTKNRPCGIQLFGHRGVLEQAKEILMDMEYSDHVQGVGNPEPAMLRLSRPSRNPSARGGAHSRGYGPEKCQMMAPV